MSRATGHFITAELEQIITVALLNLASDANQPPVWRDMAQSYADALQNDTSLLETAEDRPA